MTTDGKALMLGVAVLVGLSLGIFWNHPTGYCFKERRVIPDEELLEGALLSLKPQMKLDGSEALIQTYLAKHPGCCRIVRGEDKSLLIERDQIFSVFAFEFNDEEFNRGKARYYEKDIVWDACGKVIEHSGSSSNIPPPGFNNSTQGK
jgi:hypothetical protein